MIGHILVIPLSPVGENDFREGISEEVHEALRTVIGRIAVSVVAVLGESIHSSLRTECEVRVNVCISVPQELETLGALQDSVNVRNREFPGSIPIGTFRLNVSELIKEH